uniref:TLC domain-containing protein n=1 Tax=Meloidogyne javanica TaxID=6303 RepID=A0A915MSD3_MELJA
MTTLLITPTLNSTNQFAISFALHLLKAGRSNKRQLFAFVSPKDGTKISKSLEPYLEGGQLNILFGSCKSQKIVKRVVEVNEGTLLQRIHSHLFFGFAGRSKFKRVSETAWRFTYYSCICIAGFCILRDQPQFTFIAESFRNWPNHHLPTHGRSQYFFAGRKGVIGSTQTEDSLVRPVWWYYVIQTGFYWSLIFSILTFDVKRSDHIEMALHHMATIILLAMSFTNKVGGSLYPEIGSVIQASSQGVEATGLRWGNLLQRPIIPRVFLLILCFLLILHFFWTYILLKIAIKSVNNGVDDIREVSDGEEEGGGGDDSRLTWKPPEQMSQHQACNQLTIIKQDAMLVRNAVILLENEKESLRKAIRKLKLVDVDDGRAPESEYDYDDLSRDFYLIGGIHDPLSLRFEVTIRDKEGIEHKSAERFYWYKMAEKFGDEECKKKLMQAPNVQTAEEAVKNIQKFDSKVWDEVKHDIWEEGQRLKLDQVRWICNLLVLTKTTYLAVASEDKFFGTGWRKNRDESNKPVFWDGENEGGKILMNLRHELKKTHQFNGPQEEEVFS